jgi:mannose-6-phosphate isomerase-like protein (cupin superfamily)
MGSPQIVNMTEPEEERSFSRGRFQIYHVGGQRFGRAVYQPGWRWSEHVGPLVSTALCDVAHVGLVLSGRAAVKMADGTELIMGPGDWFSVPPGHDSWVVGDEEYVSLHLLGADAYAAPREPKAATPVSKRTVPAIPWREVCEGWTLLSDPALHVIQERMPAKTCELRHVHEATVQFYYVLDGQANVVVGDKTVSLSPGEGIEIVPGEPHQMRNDSGDSLEFLVASSRPPRGDRVDPP